MKYNGGNCFNVLLCSLERLCQFWVSFNGSIYLLSEGLIFPLLCMPENFLIDARHYWPLDIFVFL